MINKMNKRGFTLIELLAVIVILAIVMVVTIPSVIRALNAAKHSQFQNAADVTADWLNKQQQASDFSGAMGKLNQEYVSFFSEYCDGNVPTSYGDAKGCNLFKYEKNAITLLEASGISNPEKNIDLTRSYIWQSNGSYSIKLTALKGGSFYVNDGTPNYVISSVNDRVSITIVSLKDNADSNKIVNILEEYTDTEVDEIIGFTIGNLDLKSSRKIAENLSKYGAVISYLPDYSDDEYLENSGEVFYSSIETAMEDANSGTTSNGTAFNDSSVASMKIANNTITISLLKNIDNVRFLNFQRTTILNLNGNALGVECDAAIKKGIIINKGVSLTVDGSVENSTIKFNNINNVSGILFNVAGNLIINGGKYELIGSGSAVNSLINISKGTLNNVIINDSNIIINSPKSYVIYMNTDNTGSKVNLARCSITINSNSSYFCSGKASFNFEDCNIEANIKSTSASSYFIINNNEMDIKNVNLKINNDISAGIVMGIYNKGNLTINNFKYDINNEQGKAYAFVNYGNLDISQSIINVENSGDILYGIYSNNNLKIDNTEMKTNNSNAAIYSVYNFGDNGIVNIEGLDLYSSGDGTDLSASKTVTGIYNSSSKSVTIRNSTIVSDSSCNNPDSASGKKSVTSTGIRSISGDLQLYNVNITSNDRVIEMSQSGNLFISGGKYVAFGHGAIYFANGYGENYVQDAELISEKWSNYSGKYSIDDWANVTSCMYIGGGSQPYHSNINVYIDNCIIYDKNSKDGYFVLRGGGAGEHDSSLYVSNSTFKYDTSEKMRIDNDTHNFYVGSGNNVNDAWRVTLPKIKGVATDTVHFTNDVYRKQ